MIETKERYITLKTDLMFKKVFGSQENEQPIRKLLKEILKIKPKEIKILNNELIGRPYKDKKIEVDLIVELEDGTKINIEVNTYKPNEIINRNIYYMCRNISKDLSTKYYYDKINRHIQINIDYVGEHKRPIMRYALYDKEAKEELTNMIEIIRIDIPYYRKECYNKDINELDSLTRFLGLFGIEEREFAKKICEGDRDMEDIYNKIEEYNADEDVIGAYDYEWHQQEVHRLELRDAIKEGHKEGFEQGIEQEKIDIAKNMLDKNMDIELISDVTDLSVDKINELKESE